MIDLHCHLLPGIDDGPQTIDEVIALAAHAVASGITCAVVTPHVHVGRDGYKIMLPEYPHGHIPVGGDKFVAWTPMNRIRPLIADPERNGQIMDDVHRRQSLAAETSTQAVVRRRLRDRHAFFNNGKIPRCA